MSYANHTFRSRGASWCNFRPNVSLVRPILSPTGNFESVMTCVQFLLGIQALGAVVLGRGPVDR